MTCEFKSKLNSSGRHMIPNMNLNDQIGIKLNHIINYVLVHAFETLYQCSFRKKKVCY